MPEMTGTDVIRAAMRARSAGLARMAGDLQLSLTQLDSFVFHGGKLPPKALCLLAADLFAGHAEFDPTTDLLRPTNRTEPVAMSVRPPQFDPASRPPLDCSIRGPVPVKGAEPQPARPKRAGWL
jgi:hypothetical protein